MQTVRLSPLPFVCPFCFTQFESSPAHHRCPHCMNKVITTRGWQLHRSASRCFVLRECFDAKAWLPATWLHQFAAEEFVRQGILKRLPVCETLKGDRTLLNYAYQITEQGRVFLKAIEVSLIPDDVSSWYRGGLHLLDLLEEHVAELSDGETGAPDLVLQYLKVFLQEGRDMLVRRGGRSRLPLEASPTTIESPL